jgi:hypothetical protein
VTLLLHGDVKFVARVLHLLMTQVQRAMPHSISRSDVISVTSVISVMSRITCLASKRVKGCFQIL